MLVLSLLLILLIAGTIPAFAGAHLEIFPGKLDFGKVPQYTVLNQKIILKSTGDTPVQIHKVNSYCSCIRVPISEATIPPGDSLIIELALSSLSFFSNQEWRPHFYYNSPERSKYVRVIADVLQSPRKHKPIYVYPHSVAASQFGDVTQREFPISIINATSETVPLKLIYSDDEFFDLDFPLYILPLDTAVGKLTLNDKGVDSEFEKSITFEYIDNKSEKQNYSIPVRRKIFGANDRK